MRPVIPKEIVLLVKIQVTEILLHVNVTLDIMIIINNVKNVPTDVLPVLEALITVILALLIVLTHLIANVTRDFSEILVNLVNPVLILVMTVQVPVYVQLVNILIINL